MEKLTRALSWLIHAAVLAGIFGLIILVLRKSTAAEIVSILAESLMGAVIGVAIIAGVIASAIAAEWFKKRLGKMPHIERAYKKARPLINALLVVAILSFFAIVIYQGLTDGKSCVDFDSRGCVEWELDQ